jgi:hypothetical protein
MAEVHAWQHIYTSVEREQSPRDRGGFQTLFYSQSGLTEAEVREMEARLVYFPSDVEAVKRVFATISTGKIMVAQIVRLTEPDRLGRKGRYLAHNLVFEPEPFVQIASAPFAVFRQFPFITTVARALEEGDLQTGDIPSISFEVAPEQTPEVEAAGTWPVQTLRELVLLALRAERLAGDRLSLAFVGDPCEVEVALHAALFAVPAPLRPRCSFDTYFYHCNPVSAYYWAVGLLESPANRRLITVDTQSRQLSRDVSNQPETAYERWATVLVEEQRFEFVGRHRDHAFAICEWLEGRIPADSLVGAAPFEVVDSVFQVNHELTQALLYRKLEEALPPVLARRAFQALSPQGLNSQAWEVELYDRLRTRFRFAELAETLYRAYESHGFRVPPQEEIGAIDWLLQRADHVFLRLLCICWMDQRDALRVELQLLGEGAYRRFVQTALRFGLVQPWALPVSGKGDVFLDQYLAPDDPPERGLVALVQALLEVGEAACLSRLIPCIQAQPEPALRALAKIAVRQPGVPEPFRRAVDEAVTALPPRRTGLWAALFDRGGSG